MVAALVSALHILSLGVGLGAVFARGQALRAFRTEGPRAVRRDGFFWIKLGLFALVFVLEIAPMTTFIRWRIALRKGAPLDTRHVAAFVRTNDAQTVLVILIPFVAAAMARGLWLFA